MEHGPPGEKRVLPAYLFLAGACLAHDLVNDFAIVDMEKAAALHLDEGLLFRNQWRC
jgi:hypothetical protein